MEGTKTRAPWSARKLAPHGGHENCCRLPHCVSAPTSLSQGGRLCSCGTMTETSYVQGKKSQVGVLPDVDVIADLAKKVFFFCVILIVEIGDSGEFKKKKKVAVVVPRKYRLPMWW